MLKQCTEKVYTANQEIFSVQMFLEDLLVFEKETAKIFSHELINNDIMCAHIK